MKKGLLFLLILPGMLTYGQSDSSNESNTERYLEDQFYLGITYNFLGNTPEGLSQQNFSYGLQLGVIKDIPLNRAGTKAVGIGLGVALDTYYTNLIGIDNVSGITYSLSDGVEGFKRSKIETHLIELPLEFRWRSSTANEYRFWRLYTGVKAAYVIGARSKAVIGNDKSGFSNNDIQRLQYGPTVSFGYNTFNIHLYYALSDLFEDDVTLNGSQIDFNSWKIGVIFYIL
jgi:hypothetical protein